MPPAFVLLFLLLLLTHAVRVLLPGTEKQAGMRVSRQSKSTCTVVKIF
jgi:hypothetical protein